MLHTRLWERVPSCYFLDRVQLPGFTLNYQVRGMDGSGKCNILETGNPADIVYGVVYEMLEKELPGLDAAEGESYEKHELILMGDWDEHQAFAYIGKPSWLDEMLRPFHWYKEVVVQGARSRQLPDEYVQTLDQVEVQDDPDQERAQKHYQLLKIESP